MINHEQLIELIEQRLKILGLSAREASIRAVNNPELIRSIRNNHSPSLNNLQKLLNILKIELSLYSEDQNPQHSQVPLLGLIGAGNRIAYFNDQQSTAKTVDFPNEAPCALAAVEIRGTSMEPVYRQGDILFFCPEESNRHEITQHIGHDCIVNLNGDASPLLKTVECGTVQGLWNLHSHNPTQETLHNQDVSMAMPIRWVKRR